MKTPKTLSLLILMISLNAHAGMSGASQCQECQKADNSVQMLCTLETKDVKGPVDEDAKERADGLRARHQAALTEGLKELNDPSMKDRHSNMGLAAAGKANASKDSAESCRQARKNAENKCKNECSCTNCKEAEGQAAKWDAQAAEDQRFANSNFDIQESSDARTQQIAKEYAERARLKEINRTPAGYLYPQQTAR